jgi:hypothetical protein
LHAAVFEAATALRNSSEESGAPWLVCAQGARVVKWFLLMNWTRRPAVGRLIGELEQLATAPVPRAQRDQKPLQQVLGDIIALTYAAPAHSNEPNRMAGLEL